MIRLPWIQSRIVKWHAKDRRTEVAKENTSAVKRVRSGEEEEGTRGSFQRIE